MEAEQDQDCGWAVRNGLYLLTLGNGDMALAAETEHGYDAVLRTHLDLERAWTEDGDGTGKLRSLFFGVPGIRVYLDLAWDGERLAVCGEDIQTHQGIVAVADGTGLRFLGRYDYSPLWCGAASWDSSYLPAMTVQWTAAP